ncbi:hypothetical protein [Anaerotignum sp. MSJ-24]|uniref:hypothetical protein n=1 Tax=Anaerotignum sp. MSJ-24 TaxID=2841521 RepID=UPI001C12534A|nr:hypothetical protein [Anaerotignum sp. MSJ-24]MBU5463651.1 hypothetical protein [Anaerotignum sp. MSJ-24]
MKYVFTEQDKQDEVNKIELEGEDVMLIGEYIEDVENEENTYTITGDAVIEGELYHEFVTIFGTVEPVEEPTARAIAMAEWDWFDYVC